MQGRAESLGLQDKWAWDGSAPHRVSIQHPHFPCLSFPQARRLNSISCTLLCYRAAALWPEKAEGGAGTLPVLPSSTEGLIILRESLMRRAGSLIEPWSYSAAASPNLSLFDFTIRQVLPVIRGTRGCTARPGAEYILLGTRQTPPQSMKDGAGVEFVHKALPPWFRGISATNIFLSNSEWDLTEHIPP